MKCWVASRLCRSSALAGGQDRQQLVFLLAAGGPDPAVAVELLHLALGLEESRAGGDRHVGDHEDGRGHLAGDEPGVDELVEPELVVGQRALDPDPA